MSDSVKTWTKPVLTSVFNSISPTELNKAMLIIFQISRLAYWQSSIANHCNHCSIAVELFLEDIISDNWYYCFQKTNVLLQGAFLDLFRSSPTVTFWLKSPATRLSPDPDQVAAHRLTACWLAASHRPLLQGRHLPITTLPNTARLHAFLVSRYWPWKCKTTNFIPPLPKKTGT